MKSRREIRTSEEYNVSLIKQGRTLSTSVGETYSFSRVVKSFKAGDENEISLEQGDLVEILSEDDSSRKEKRMKLDLGGEIEDILDNSAAKHKLSIRPKKKYTGSRQKEITSSSESSRCLVRTVEDDPRQGWVSSEILQHQSNEKENDSSSVHCKREAVVKELLETEEEFGRDLNYVVEHYLKPAMDGSCTPTIVRDNVEIIFSNLQQISNFHNTILIEGIKYYSNEPRMLGKTFLRLERDFDKHIAYCRDEPLAQEFLAENPNACEFFEELSQKLGDGKNISEYLKLPVQRINDYQVLLKDLVKYSDRLGESTHDLKRALELMLAIPQRANDNKFLSNIEGYHGNIHKLGRLLRHDWFTVVFDENTSKERYLFLFKGHILVCKVKKISEDRSVFTLKDLIALSEVKIQDCPDEKTFEVFIEDLGTSNGSIKIIARKENTKNNWLSEIKKHVPGVFEIEKGGTEDIQITENVSLETDNDKGDLKQPPTEHIIQVEKESPIEDSNRVTIEKPSKEVTFDKVPEEGGEAEAENMNRRYSTKRSLRSYEESYSVSSQRESTYLQSSTTASSQYSSTAVYDSRSLSSQNYESSSITGSTRAASIRANSNLAITSADKPVFTKTITGLNLEPGETAVFECQLESEAQLTWLKDNKALEDRLADRVVRSSSDDGTHRLELQHVCELDSGIYTALAQKDDNYSTCTAQLLVQNISEEERQRRNEANAPVFTVRLKDTELLKNTNFRFMVKVKGSPNPDVRFYKDGIPIRSGRDDFLLVNEKAEIGFYELVITDVQTRHAGLYSCKASNIHGEAHCEGTITVTDDKKVFDGLESEILLTPGEKPTFTWLKDGKSFDPDERFKVLLGNEDDSLALIFQHVKPEDAGLYTCVASTTTGRISCSAELSVQGSVSPLSREPEKPKISRESKSTEATIGESAMLEAKVLGFPRPDVKWYHDGEEIKASGRFKFLYEDQETMTLIIKNVNPRDGGCYKIIAKNELGEDCTELNLTVKGAPRIIKKLEDVQVMSEEVIKITCEVEGSPTPDVKWYKDGNEIKETERIKIIKESSEKYSLVIEKASLSDSGSYSIVASNEINQCSDFCKVTVRSAPKILKNMEKNIEVSEGDELTFKIQLAAEPGTKVKWLKDGVEIKSDEKKSKITVDGDVHILKIFNCDANDSAYYSVEITNDYGSCTDNGKASVNPKKSAPVFKKGLKDILTKEGEIDVELSVEVNAYPKPKIRWYLDEMEITEKRTEFKKTEEDNNYKLILKKVTTELKGTYTCRVENEFGSAETSAKLTVHSKPKFQMGLQPKVTVDEGAELTLQVECSGCPEPEITWFKDGQEVQTDAHIKITKDSHRSESYSMTLTLIQGSDSGEYEAKATNCMGSATTQTYVQVFSKVTESAEEEVVSAVKQEKLEASQKAEISAAEEEDSSVQEKPSFKVPLKNQHCSQGETCVFECVVVGNPEPEVTWLFNGKEVKADGKKITKESSAKEVDKNMTEYTYKLKISEPASADAGLYLIKAENKYGYDESSASLTIQIPAEDGKPEIKNLKDITGIPGSEGVFEAEIISKTSLVVTWLDKNGEKIKSSDRIIIIEETEKMIYKLIIKSIKTEDEGEYTLVATNESGEAKKRVKLFLHGEKPTIVKPLEDAQIKDGQDVDLLVRCNGIPKPDVKWFKDGKEIVGDDRITIKTQTEGQVSSSLSIEKFQAEDEGQYKVTATNSMGCAENPFKLKMSQIAPVFEKALPRSEEVDEGEVLELKCKLSGSPIPALKWLKDGEPLIPSDRVKVVKQPDGLVKLSVEDMKPSDSGTYSLVAENPNGQITANCAVAVQPKTSKPKVIDGLKSSKAVVGQPIRLEAKVVGFPLPEVKWFKDGRPIRPSQAVISFNENDGTLALAINSVKPEDAGVYSVKISNKLGEVAQEAKIDVLQPEEKPKFESYMSPVSAVEGSPAKFEVKATGNPKPIIKWSHNGKEIVPDGERIIVTEEPDGTVCLILNNTTPEDAGEYAATAINDMGEASCKAKLDVLGKTMEQEQEAPSFIRPLNNVAIEEDNKLTLSAPIAGNPVPEVVWEKDGKPLKSDDRVLLTCDGKKVTLEIKNCKPSDSGLYNCYLKNPLGEAKSKANVDVKKIYKEPEFIEKFKDMEQLNNTDARFVARISGFPKPEVEWFFNGKPIEEGDKYQIRCDGDKYTLQVKNCSPEDKGLYRCSAFNKAGRAECVANLDVVKKVEAPQRAEPPAFLKKISDCDIYKGMTAKFTACCTGFPNPEFEWFRDNEKLSPSNRIKMDSEDNGLIRLTILGVDDNDVGKYRLRIFNPHGEAECSANLICDVLEPRPKRKAADTEEVKSKTVGGLPLPLSDKPIISRMTDRHLTLSWKPYIPLGPQPPVTYIVEMCKQPDGDWFTARGGIRSCACDIRNLEPFQDYKFRVRVENKYGISYPSPFAVTYRQKIIPDPPKFVPYLSPGIDFRPETSPYFPKDFDLERPPHDRYEQAPKFLRQEHEVQYGIKNQNSNLFWFVYGYPKPTMTYFFNGEPIEMGGRYSSSYTRNGQATLFINSMLDRDVGYYEAVATNEHGEARQRVRMEIAEHPVFILRPEESYIMLRNSGQLTARIVGVPYPEIKWYKDWQPLAPSSRIKIQQTSPDTVTLTINDAIFKDEGLYSVSATNVAGTVSSSAMVHIEEEEEAYRYATYGGGLNIKARPEPLSNYYDLGDELGRGTQGITYHAVERRSGQNYAAKFMHGRSELKTFMLNELNIMNSLNHRKLIRLHDSFETKDLLVLILELGGGGGLLEWLTRQTHITESEIADYIRQILWGLEYMHTNGFAHLSLTLNDLLLSRPDGDDLKICDFGLSRRITHGNLLGLNYGMPEFVAPEVANGEGVDYAADMWSLGIITYILLSGRSPFKGVNDRETLTRIKEGKWIFEEEYFTGISSEARDFITRLLTYKSEDRMKVKDALRHPWLEKIGLSLDDQYKIKTDNLRNYYTSLRSWYNNANCRTWYRRQPLSNAFTHPSKMVYPPAHDYTPEPELNLTKTTKQFNGRPPTDTGIPGWEPPEYEAGNFKSESHYQYGPDTYLLQLRDVDLPCRLRHYMKVAANRELNYTSEPPEKHIDWKMPVIRERRKFMDVMDEEIDDERRARISQYGSDDIYSLRRLKHEIGCRSDGHAEAEAMLEYKREGHLPFFREKPQNLAIIQNQAAEFSCMVVGEPDPVVQWFKNDLVLAESSRIKMRADANKRHYLKFEPALQVDTGVYKVVARNKVGQTVARMRMVLATVPLSPDPPEVVESSDTEVQLKWKPQTDDVFTPVLCYWLQYKQEDSEAWTDVAKNIDHEFWLVKNLQPSTSYLFRMASKNCVGWSAPGIPTSVVKTKESGSPKITIPEIQRQIQSQTEKSDEGPVQESKPNLDYSIEDAPMEWTLDSNLDAKYQFTTEIFRGEFSLVVKGVDKSNNQQIAAKVFEVNSNTEKQVAQEFENIRSLRHERVVLLLAALRPAPNIAVFVMEKLQGADILSYFASRDEYNEDMVVTVLIQVLDGLQYLHWRGFCHLDIQPDNIVLSSVRALQVKLVDFGSAKKVSKLGTVVSGPATEYSAPEILSNEPAFPQTDIWSLGTLTYVLLSGASPFRAETFEETKQNIIFVRYRFEYLYKEITQEATRFLMQIFKRTPSKRPTVEECYETRWLLSTEFMIKKRQKASFPGIRLKEFNEAYHSQKSGKCSADLGKVFGDKVLKGSNSIQEE